MVGERKHVVIKVTCIFLCRPSELGDFSISTSYVDSAKSALGVGLCRSDDWSFYQLLPVKTALRFSTQWNVELPTAKRLQHVERPVTDAIVATKGRVDF